MRSGFTRKVQQILCTIEGLSLIEVSARNRSALLRYRTFPHLSNGSTISFMSHTFTFPNNVIEVRGAVDHDIDKDGRYTPVRLPRWTRAQMSDVGILRMAQMGSGVRLRFRSSATRIEMKLLMTRIFVVGLHGDPQPTYYELRINGDFHQKQGINGGNFIQIILNSPNVGAEEIKQGPSDVLVFSDLPAGDKEMEIWLPASTSSAIESITADAEIFPPHRLQGRSGFITEVPSVNLVKL
jgi:hypothetical protein